VSKKNQTAWNALVSALTGLPILFREKAVRRELALILASVALLLNYRNLLSLLLLVLSLVLLAFEALNTAIEMLCDHITPRYDVIIKRVKDVAASAVLIISLTYLFTLIGLLEQAYFR
jgi:diacylglycerol kinase (ATP)